ncbi:MAG: hypothetical protein OEZ34_16820, partial [Spirochaetia bacterium]|nr:hypothetical protein [Spirochaetia bacterium]
KPWRRWRNFRYMCSGNDSDEGITKTQLYITKSKFRAVMISLPDSTGESIPVFFDRMSGAKNINLEHKQVISASNHSGMKSLSVELKKNGRYSFAANHAVVLQYSVSLSKWISLENQSDDASEITSCKGKLQKGDRLILSAGTHVDEMNLLLDEISKSKDEWTQSVSGGASRGRSIFIMRD